MSEQMAQVEMTDREFAERLVRIETKLDHIVEAQIKNTSKHDTLEERLKTVEDKVNRFLGALVVLNFLLLFFAEKIRGLFG
jgi:hypothetical protein